MATLDGWLIYAIPYLIIKKKRSPSLSLQEFSQRALWQAAEEKKLYIYIHIYVYTVHVCIHFAFAKRH